MLIIRRKAARLKLLSRGRSRCHQLLIVFRTDGWTDGRTDRPAEAAIAKVFAKMCKIFLIWRIFWKRRTLEDVENYALSKFQP